MVRFVDKYIGSRIQGWPVEVAPMTSTQIAQVDSGAEQANQRWYDPLREISIPQGFRAQGVLEALKNHWLVMGGPARVWPWRDPTDFASCELDEPNVEPTVDAVDQPLGVGDGVTLRFQLVKRYDLGSPTTPYDRIIRVPVVDSIVIAEDGVITSPAMPYTVERYGGWVDFVTPPAVGVVLTWGGFFDIPVRFESDDTYRGIMRTAGVSGFADIPLREVRYCED